MKNKKGHKSVRFLLKEKGIEFTGGILHKHKPLSPDGLVVGLDFKMDNNPCYFTVVISLNELLKRGIYLGKGQD